MDSYSCTRAVRDVELYELYELYSIINSEYIRSRYQGEFGGLGVPEITGVHGVVAPDGAVAATRHFYILPSAAAAAFGRAAAAPRQLPPRATRGADVTGPGAALVDAADMPALALALAHTYIHTLRLR